MAKMGLPPEVVAEAVKDKELERINSQLETVTNTVFGCMREAKERAGTGAPSPDLEMTLRCCEMVIRLVELRARLASTFLRSPEEENGAYKEGGGGA